MDMLTRRSSQTTILLLTTLLAFTTACDDGDDGDTAGEGETGDTGNTSGNTSNTSGNTSNTSGNTDGNDDSDSEICDEACINLMACGFPVDECLSFCSIGPCGECLASSDSCGQDCANACAGDGDGDGDGGDGDGDAGDGDGDGDPIPPKNCVINDDCGLSFECVSCNLTDGEGWCEQSMDCTWDEDCGFGGKCGYNVETADYRCLPASYCP
jgi:hypothetical protein